MKTTICLIAMIVLFCAMPGRVDATSLNAPITWGSPRNISGDTDVVTTGTLVGAFNIGAAGVSSTTVNGVTFAPFAIPNDLAAGTTAVGNFFLHYDARSANNTAYGSTAAPFSGLSASYQSLLTSGSVDQQNSGITLTMSGLTPGRAYTFEWWCNWSAANTSALTSAHAINTMSLDNNITNLNGGLGQFAIGTFTALSGFETVIYDSSLVPFLNAFQLRAAAVPEPASWSLLAGGGLGMLLLRRLRPQIACGKWSPVAIKRTPAELPRFLGRCRR